MSLTQVNKPNKRINFNKRKIYNLRIFQTMDQILQKLIKNNNKSNNKMNRNNKIRVCGLHGGEEINNKKIPN